MPVLSNQEVRLLDFFVKGSVELTNYISVEQIYRAAMEEAFIEHIPFIDSNPKTKLYVAALSNVMGALRDGEKRHTHSFNEKIDMWLDEPL